MPPSVDLNDLPSINVNPRPQKPDVLECRVADFALDSANPELENQASDWWTSTDRNRLQERNVTGPTHFISLSRPIHILSRRAVTFLAADGHVPFKPSHLRLLYVYHAALIKLCDVIDVAVRKGSITPRDDLLGLATKLPHLPKLEKWRRYCESTAGGQIEADVEVQLKEALSEPAEDIFPGLMVDIVEFAKWAESMRIAEPAYLEEALANSAPAFNGSPASRQAPPANPWVLMARALADELCKLDPETKRYPSKLALATEISKRFADTGIEGKRGRLDPEYIVRHALTAWEKPDHKVGNSGNADRLLKNSTR